MLSQPVIVGSAASVGPPERLRAIRHAFLNRLWGGMFLLALIGTPMSVMRAQATGWLPVYSLHLAAGLLFVAVYFARNVLSYRVKLATLFAVFVTIGCSGIFSFGLLGSSVWFLVMCSFLASTFFSMRAGVVVAIATGLILVFAAYLFTTGVLKVPIDANAYITSPTGWGTLLITTSIMPFLVSAAFGVYQKTIIDLLHELQQQRDHIADLAARDDLTGLPLENLANDRLMMKMHSAIRDRTRIAFMFVDLNGFKAVNDTWGHEAGDRFLQAIATRLKNSVRVEDTVARVGGDEFIVILGNLKDRNEAVPVAEKIIAAVSVPVAYAGQSIISGVSIGISIFPEDATDIATLRRLADRAMYQIKRTGENGFAFADSATRLSEMPAET